MGSKNKKKVLEDRVPNVRTMAGTCKEPPNSLHTPHNRGAREGGGGSELKNSSGDPGVTQNDDLLGVTHPAPSLGVCYTNDPRIEGYMHLRQRLR